MTVLQRSQNNKSDLLIKLLLVFYVVWKMPIVALYTNTYLAMIALVLLMIQLFKDGDFLYKAPMMFAAAIAMLLITMIDLSQQVENWFNIVWSCFLDFLPMILGAVLIYYKKDNLIRTVVPVLLITYVITCITTYNGLQEYPMASRELATGSVDYAPYYAKNIGGFNFIYSLVILHPMFVCVLWGHKKKILSIALTVLIGICIMESRYTTAALTFLISCVAYVLPTQEGRKNNVARWILIVLIMVVVYAMAPAILDRLAETEALEASSDKLKDIAKMLRGESTDTESFMNREKAYEQSWKGFLRSPIWGCEIMTGIYSYNGGHSYVLDMLAKWGVLGILPVIYALRLILKYYRQMSKGHAVFYCMLLSYGLLLVLIFLNASFWSYEAGFLVPVFAYYAMMLERKPEDAEQEQSIEEKTV